MLLVSLNPMHCCAVFLALQEHKKRRTSSLPDGVSYDGNSFAGRVNFLPSSAALALIGKRTTSWKRLQGGQQTHKESKGRLVMGMNV